MKEQVLKSELVLKHKNLKDLAVDIGISATALYRKVSGVSDFSASEIKKISSVLSLSNEKIIDIFFN